MPKIPDPFTITQRSDSKTYMLSLNPACGLPRYICKVWRRRSFRNLPDRLAQYRYPQDEKQAKAAAYALIFYLKKELEEGNAQLIRMGEILKTLYGIRNSNDYGIKNKFKGGKIILKIKGQKNLVYLNVDDLKIKVIKKPGA